MTAPTGADAAQARNAAAVDQLEQQATGPVRVAIAAMLAEVLTATGTGAAPAADTLAAVGRQAWTRARARIIDWVRGAYRRLLTRAVGNLPDDIADDIAPEIAPATVDQRVATLVDQLAAGLDSVPDVLAARVARALGKGYAKGESPQQLRDRVAAVLGMDEWDPVVVRIARTTTTSVYNAAHTAAADDLETTLGRPLQRMWIATQDSRTRPTHRKAHAQVVESGRPFRVGDALLRFPGDPLGPEQEIINCRCVAVPVVDDLVVDLAHRVAGREADVLDTDQPLAAAQAAPLTAAERRLVAQMVAATRIPPQLLVYWTRGEGAAKIRWGSHGDFKRCERHLAKYVNPAQLAGLCANLHHAAVGVWPGQEGQAAAADDESEDAMPCPCENMTDEEIAAAAATVAATAAGAVAAGVSGDPDLPIAARDTEWDGEAAADRVRQWATVSSDDEGIDVERYASAFFWTDPDADPTTQTAYKLGFADVVGEDLVAVPAGVFAAAAALDGARGGVDIPESDVDDVRGRISHYYTRMAAEFDDEGLMAPWDRADPNTESMADTPPGEDEAGMGAACTCTDTSDDTSDDTEDDTEDDGDALVSADLSHVEDMAMIALVPADQDAARLALGTGAEGETELTAEQMHLTLAILGEGQPLADSPHRDHVLELAQRIGADMGPITVRLWAAAVGNGNTDGPVAFYLAGDDTGRLAMLQGGVLMGLAGIDLVPPQHSPWVAHLSTRYGDGSLDGMDQVGTDVVLDRVRVEIAGEITDFPLTGDDTLDDTGPEDDQPPAEDDTGVEPGEDEMPAATATATATVTARATVTAGVNLSATPRPDGRWDIVTGGGTVVGVWPQSVVAGAMVAATADTSMLAEVAANAPERPPAAWFQPIAVDGPVPPMVTAQGRMWGHIGQAIDEQGQPRCHVGITDECVPIPPTRTDYGAFHREDLVADDGTEQGATVRVGYLYTGCEHSPMDATIDQARGYLDSACTRTAAGRVYDTEWGPMFVGALVPGVTAGDVARLWKLSGEWFTAPLELHAAVGVEDAGFPVDGTSPDGLLVSDEDPPALAAARACGPGEVVETFTDAVAGHRARAAAREAGAVVARVHRARRNRAAAVVAGYTKRG